MGDLRNKIAKMERDEQVRRMQARLTKPPPPPWRPVCANCGLGVYDRVPGSSDLVRLFAVAGNRGQSPTVYCEGCLEPMTGEKPFDL